MKKIAPSRIAAAFAGLTALTGALPAHAQSLAPASAIGISKTEAILGGAPSRLAAILSLQASASASVTPSAYPLRPAVYSEPTYTPFASRFDAQPALPASPDRPDIFGSIALPIAHSPLDARWNRVGTAGVGGAAGAFAAALRGSGERARLEAVNAYVNGHISFVDDRVQYGIADRWSTASDSLARGRGDCEDYAIAKLAMLRRAGFADHNLYLVILKDLVRRADHAVLVVRSEGHFLVLDNGTNRLLDSAEVRDYRPILTFTAGHSFTHGYRRSVTPPVVLASVAAPAPAYAMAMAGGMPTSMFARRR